MVIAVMAHAAAHYAELKPELERAFAESLLFKAEEVRCSTEMAKQAGAQGL